MVLSICSYQGGVRRWELAPRSRVRWPWATWLLLSLCSSLHKEREMVNWFQELKQASGQSSSYISWPWRKCVSFTGVELTFFMFPRPLVTFLPKPPGLGVGKDITVYLNMFWSFQERRHPNAHPLVDAGCRSILGTKKCKVECEGAGQWSFEPWALQMLRYSHYMDGNKLWGKESREREGESVCPC